MQTVQHSWKPLCLSCQYSWGRWIQSQKNRPHVTVPHRQKICLIGMVIARHPGMPQGKLLTGFTLLSHRVGFGAEQGSYLSSDKNIVCVFLFQQHRSHSPLQLPCCSSASDTDSPTMTINPLAAPASPLLVSVTHNPLVPGIQINLLNLLL